MAAVAPLVAQEPGPIAAGTRVRVTVPVVPGMPGVDAQPVGKVSPQTREVRAGTLAALTRDSLVITDVRGQRWVVSRAAVYRVEAGRGLGVSRDHVWTGVAIGGALGFGVGANAAAGGALRCRGTLCNAPVFGVRAGGVGMALGAIVGRLVPGERWVPAPWLP